MLYTIIHPPSFQGVSFLEKYWRSLWIAYFAQYGGFIWKNVQEKFNEKPVNFHENVRSTRLNLCISES